MADSIQKPFIVVPMFAVYGDVNQALAGIAQTLKPLFCADAETAAGNPKSEKECNRPRNASPKQREWVSNLIRDNHLNERDVCDQFGISSINDMNRKQASEFINMYKPDKKPHTDDSPEKFF